MSTSSRYQPLFGSAHDPSYFFEVKFDVLHRFEMYYGICVIMNLVLSSWVIVNWINMDSTMKITSNPTCDTVLSDINRFGLICIIAACINALLVLILPIMLKARLFSIVVLKLIFTQSLLTIAKSAIIGIAFIITIAQHLSTEKCGMKTGLYDHFTIFTWLATLVTFSELTLGHTFLYAIGMIDVIQEGTALIFSSRSMVVMDDELNKLI